jgi:hypothetical protein
MIRTPDAQARRRGEAPATPDRGEHFVVRSGPIPEGHERLTRDAAAGLAAIGPAQMSALIAGVRRPDTESIRNHLIPAQQRRHALRASLCQPLAAALSEMRNHLASLHARALAAGPSATGFGLAGEALHLIQDSYSPAHVARSRGAAGRHPITYIRYYGLTTSSPQEHQFPFDRRDLVAPVLGGPLNGWAREAVRASREYLALILREWRAPAGPAALRAYMDRQLSLSASHTEPRDHHFTCRLGRR